ncbi:esterase-like activity of phytase family protein [Erythrobacter sp. HKB08]|uniref:esterase-like activity of phytase family protein n=1 Tax=Erythrobacter sp. HKB08 TaxID=2502843 RepID=UPI001008990B|nr:esterase-like activity of phytase family protein [Erythrobacter sp. HKB08]
MAMRRVILTLLLALALAPGTFLRSASRPFDERSILGARELDVARPKLGEITVEAVWELTTPNSHFGSYSALVALDDGSLLAASDAGRYLRFDPSDAAIAPRFGRTGGDSTTRKGLVDVEAMTRDPDSDTIWLAYEGTNTIERRTSALELEAQVRPERMQAFGANSGAEAMTRLPDGRFVVLSEGPRNLFGSVHTGLVFDGDPTEGAKAQRFAIELADGFRPVDMATLPDGRVLILARKLVWGIPPGFRSRLLIADPRGLEEDAQWSGELLADFGDALPQDNYEGLAVVPQEDGSFVLWMISDDNNATLQRTLLAKLRWVPKPDGSQAKQKARSRATRP